MEGTRWCPPPPGMEEVMVMVLVMVLVMSNSERWW